MKISGLTAIAAASIAIWSCGGPHLNEDNIDKVISELTTEEKVRLLVGTSPEPANPPYPAPGTMKDRPKPVSEVSTSTVRYDIEGCAGVSYRIDRLGIPPLVYADGPAGLRINPLREGTPEQEYYCTAFPSATVLASSWNRDISMEVGKAIGEEVREYGVDIILGPGMNIKRNPLTGRNFEYYSEDPLLSGEIAASVTSGIQTMGVGACIKHFAVNNQETYRNGIDVIVDEQALREIYLKGFEIAVRKASPWTIMSSYNKINGEYASESCKLLTDILRNEWGFDGYVMTDWWGADDPVRQMKAGNNILMPGTTVQIGELLDAVKDAKIEDEVLDRNLRDVLSVMTRTPSFSKYGFSNAPDLASHAEISRKAATEGMVLLKNSGVLPMDSCSVALFGNFSYDTQAGGSGSGYVHRKYKININEGLSDAGFRVDKELEGQYKSHIAEAKSKMPAENFWTIPIAPEMRLGRKDIEQAAERNDMAVMTLGRMSGEGTDRHCGKGDYLLSDEENRMLKDICRTFHKAGKKVLVILNMGDAIEFTGWKDIPDAILMAWLPGQEAGHAIADILTGKVNPSGKLPMTMALRYEDIPSSRNFGVSPGETNVVRYEEGLMVGYRYFCTAKAKTAYPFGYGLSYTDFEYSGFEVTRIEGNTVLKLKVTNTGDRCGKECVQFYVRKPEISSPRPAMELCAFHKTALLEPGESEDIVITLTEEDLRQWDTEKAAWATPETGYVFHAAASAEDIRQTVAD